MNDNRHSEIEQVKKQLELCKHQDQLLEEIEVLLHEMKKIALYAAASKLPSHESEHLNNEILKKQQAIHVLEGKLLQLQSTLYLQ